MLNARAVAVLLAAPVLLPWSAPRASGQDPTAGSRESADLPSRAAATADRVKTQFGIDRTYSGKFADDPRLVQGMRRIEAALPLAADRVRRRLGAPSLEFPPVSAGFMDGEGSRMAGDMCVNVLRRDGRMVAVVLVATESLVANAYEEVHFLSHELSHALQQAGTGNEESPAWLREGLACWVSCEDESELRERVLQVATCPGWDRESPIPDLLGDEMRLARESVTVNAACGSLAFYRLERSRGTGAVRRLALRLMRAADWETALREETGRTAAGLLQDTRGQYAEWERTGLAGLELCRHVGRMVMDGRHAAAIAMLKGFAADHPVSPVRPIADLQRADLLSVTGDGEGSLAVLRAVRRGHPRTGYVAWTYVLELRALCSLGEWQEAASLARHVLREVHWRDDPARKEVRRMLEEASRHLDPDPSPAPAK